MASKLCIKTKEVSCPCDGISITNPVAVNQQKCQPNIKFVLFSN